MSLASRRLATPVLALLLAGAVDAETYAVDATHSAVDFSIRHMVGRTKGRFAQFEGTIAFDPASPEATRISGTIQASSIDTGNEKRDQHLRSQDFFWVEEHPTITFTSTAVQKKTDTLLQVTGQLTMRGVTREVTLPVEILGTGLNPMSGKKQVGMATELTVKRSEFGVNHWSDTAGVLGDEVAVQVFVEANAQ